MTGWLTLIVVSCGYRTAPVPYEQPDKGLLVVSSAELKQQGDNWVFSWKIPQGQAIGPGVPITESTDTDSTTDIERKKLPFIKHFRIGVHRTTDSCPSCESESIGHFFIHLENGEIGHRFAKETINLPSEKHFFAEEGKRFSFHLPVLFFSNNGLIKDCFYTIDYVLNNNLLSAPSRQLYPYNLKKVQLPKIRLRKRVRNTKQVNKVRPDEIIVNNLNRIIFNSPVVDSTGIRQRSTSIMGKTLLLMPGMDAKAEIKPLLEGNTLSNQCHRPQLENFLLLEWDLQLETMRHIVQKDGKAREDVVHYGLNLYTEKQITRQPQEEANVLQRFRNPHLLINPQPLLYGSFSLLNFHGLLSARHVDRYGNESESITVFNGQY